MSILSKLLKVFVGDKSTNDVKELQPIVEQIKSEYAKLANISDDELRTRTADFKRRIAEHIKPETDRVAELKKQAEAHKYDENRENEKIF